MSNFCDSIGRYRLFFGNFTLNYGASARQLYTENLWLSITLPYKVICDLFISISSSRIVIALPNEVLCSPSIFILSFQIAFALPCTPTCGLSHPLPCSLFYLLLYPLVCPLFCLPSCLLPGARLGQLITCLIVESTSSLVCDSTGSN